MKKFDCSFGVEKKKRTKKERTERSLFSPFHSEIIFQNAHQGTVLHNNTQQHRRRRRRNDQLSIHVSLILRRGGVPDVRFDESHRS
jgi:hypothetical protein